MGPNAPSTVTRCVPRPKLLARSAHDLDNNWRAPDPNRLPRLAATSSSIPQQLLRHATAPTSAGCALPQDLFEATQGVRDRPATYSRRSALETYCCAPRTVYLSRNLPTQIYLSWLQVQKAFVRSAQQGKCETLHERLRQQWRR